jgi:hypothetical protein
VTKLAGLLPCLKFGNREFPAGTIFVEAFGTRHHDMNAGSTPARVLFIDHSEEGQSNMVKTEPPGPLHNGQDDRH